MRCLTYVECEQWCLERGYPVAVNAHYGRPEPDVRRTFGRVDLVYPVDSGRKVTLARDAIKCLQGDDEILLWVADWAVWPSSQHMGLFTRFREALGERRRLIEAPGQVLLAHEFDDAVSVLSLALLFIWDCHVFGGVGRPVFFCSHDEVASLFVPPGKADGHVCDSLSPWVAEPIRDRRPQPRLMGRRRRRA